MSANDAAPGTAAQPGAVDPAMWQRVQTSLARQGLMQHLGTRLLAVAPGEVTLAHLYDVFVFDSQYFASAAQKRDLPWASRFTELHRSSYHRVYLSELFEKR